MESKQPEMDTAPSTTCASRGRSGSRGPFAMALAYCDAMVMKESMAREVVEPGHDDAAQRQPYREELATGG